MTNINVVSRIAIGADTCDATTPTKIPVGTLGSPITTVIMGDSATATDSPSDCGLTTSWWESITLNSCANLVIDFCGTSPRIPSNYIQIYDGCDPVNVCGNVIVWDGVVGPHRAQCPGEPDPGNITMPFDGVPAGTYYYPIIANGAGGNVPGPYIMNVTAEECTGACCNPVAGTCVEDVTVGNCSAPGEEWSLSQSCDDACFGACCTATAGTCVEGVTQPTCAAPGEEWTEGGRCCEIECRDPAGPEFDAQGVSMMSNVPLSSFATNPAWANEVWGYTSPSGREYAIMGLECAFAIIEVTDPFAPNIIIEIPGSCSVWRDTAIHGQFAYGVADAVGDGMYIMDLTNIDAGVVNWTVQNLPMGGEFFERAHNAIVNPDSGYLYLGIPNNLGGEGLAVFDTFTNPAVPAYVGQWTDGLDFVRCHDMQIITYTTAPYAGQEIAFCFGEGNGLYIADVTNKAAMVTLGSLFYPNTTYAHQGWIDDDRQYVYLGDELDERDNPNVSNTTTYVINVSDLSNPTLETEIVNQWCSIDHNLHVKGSNVYASNYTSGLRIYNVSDVNNIYEVGYFDSHPESNATTFDGTWGNYPFLPSGNILLSDRARGLFVLDARAATGGACCDTVTSICTDGVQEEDCVGVFTKGGNCQDAGCNPCPAQPSDLVTGFFSDLECDVCGPAPQLVADNFELGAGEQLDILRFWGGYDLKAPLALDRFTIAFYEDAAGVPGTLVNLRSGIEADFRFQTGNTVSGRDEYEYFLNLRANKLIGPGRFWVEIFADSTGDANTWAWNTAAPDPVHGIPGAAASPTFPEPPWFGVPFDFAFEIQCKPSVFPKFSQLPKGNGEDIPSDIDWTDEAPNVVAADDWVSDGRPVTAVRWWGSQIPPKGFVDTSGPLTTHPNAGVGGADVSMLQNNSLGMALLGHAFQSAVRNSDDFTITDPGGTVVNQITVFGYQTGAPTAPTTFTSATLRIWDGPPDDGGSSVVFGDTTTNRLISANWSGIYRSSETLGVGSTDRPIMALKINAGVNLAPGTYWADWATTGSGAFSGPFAPPVTILGLATTGNAKQFDAGAWSDVIDTDGTNTPQGFPMIVDHLTSDVQPDGWFISFHEPVEPGTPPDTPLGLFFCDVLDVNQSVTGLPACDAHPVREYFVGLDKCCLVHQRPDSRTGHIPAVKGQFLEEACGHYTLDIQAVVGHKFVPDLASALPLNACIEVPTSKFADGDYWGWHTTDNERGRFPALDTQITMAGPDWLYGPWNPVVPACSQPNMAFQLLTWEPVPTLPDEDDDGIPDACECPPSAKPISTLADTGFGIGNRTLVIETDPIDAGSTQAIRVVFTDLKPPYDIWNGEELWVQNPSLRCENSGEAFPPCTGPSFWAAPLGCAPFYADWSTFGPIHAHHEGVIPASLYTVDVIDAACLLSDPLSFSPPLDVATSKYGDCCGSFTAGAYPPPQGSTDIVIDVIAVLAKFSNALGAPINSRADLEPANIDWRVNITDVLQALKGFSALPYPFTPSVGDPCP